jgi:hypothetical protein
MGSADNDLKPATVTVTDFYRPLETGAGVETVMHTSRPRKLVFHVRYQNGAEDNAGRVSWTATCTEVAGFVAEGAVLGRGEIGAAILDQLAEFRDPQP